MVDDPPMRQLAPAARLRWRVTGIIGTVVFALVVAVPLGFLVRADTLGARVLLVPVAIAVVFAPIDWWHANARYRRFGFRLDHDVLWVRDGVLWHSDTALPLFRVQHVDLQRGPLQLLFGLTTLVVHTAAPAADATLPDILADDAEALRDQVLAAAHDAAAALGTVDVDAV